MSTDLGAADLARFRMLFAAAVLVMLPSYAWAGNYPAAMWQAPPGPMMLFDGPPPVWVLAALELAVAATMGALLAGRWVVTASVLASLFMALGAGFTYGFGKVDHDILLVLTPIVMAGVGWSGNRQPSALALRLWAFAIGLAILFAGLVKALSGWLELSTHAVYGTVTTFRYLDGRQGPLTDLALAITPSWVWEAMDWATVLLECAVVVSVLSWRWFRRSLALLCVFHLAVAFVLGIVYVPNVVAYGAFVPWSLARRWFTVPTWTVLPAAVAAWLIGLFAEPVVLVGPVIVVIGAALGAAVLLRRIPRVRRA